MSLSCHKEAAVWFETKQFSIWDIHYGTANYLYFEMNKQRNDMATVGEGVSLLKNHCSFPTRERHEQEDSISSW